MYTMAMSCLTNRIHICFIPTRIKLVKPLQSVHESKCMLSKLHLLL